MRTVFVGSKTDQDVPTSKEIAIHNDIKEILSSLLSVLNIKHAHELGSTGTSSITTSGSASVGAVAATTKPTKSRRQSSMFINLPELSGTSLLRKSSDVRSINIVCSLLFSFLSCFDYF